MHIKALARKLISKLDPLPPYYTLGAEKKIKLESVEGFGPIATRILAEQRTYLHYDRLYTLWQGIEGVTPDSIVIEVGAYKGGSAKFIHDALRSQNKQNDFYVCDTFKGHPVVDSQFDGEHKVAQGFSDVKAADVSAYLSECKNTKIVIGNIMETAIRIPHEPIGFLHLDCDVYPATAFCLGYFGREMVHGGVIVVDDYGFNTCKGARVAVDEYVTAFPYFRTFHLTTGQAVLICLL